MPPTQHIRSLKTWSVAEVEEVALLVYGMATPLLDAMEIVKARAGIKDPNPLTTWEVEIAWEIMQDDARRRRSP